MNSTLCRWMIVLCAAAMLIFSGCAGTSVISSSDTPSSQWAEFGLKMFVPSGSWEVETIEKNRTVRLTKVGSPATIVLMNVPARKNATPAIELKRLFVHFDTKTQLESSTLILKSGKQAVYGAYNVEMNNRTRHVQALVFPHNAHMMHLIGWGLTQAEFDLIASSITPAAKGGKQ